MKVAWRRRARRDLHELIAYIAEDSIQAAELVANRVRNAVKLLEEMPRAGRPGRVAETRELVVSNTPYILAYRIHLNAISILRIYHGARRWPSRFD